MLGSCAITKDMKFPALRRSFILIPMVWGKYFSVTLFVYWPCHKVCGILVPRLGIEPRLSAVKAESQPLDHQGSPSQSS